MLFTSYEFIFFLIACFALYYLIPKKYQWLLLLIASYGFYFSADRIYPVFLFATTCITYITAILIEKRREQEKEYLKVHAEEFSTREERKAFKQKQGQKRRRIRTETRKKIEKN